MVGLSSSFSLPLIGAGAKTMQGPVVRISQDDLITSDPELVLRMNAVRSPYLRSAFYKAAKLDPTRDNILSTMDEGKHQALRQKMAAGVCRSSNSSPTFSTNIAELLPPWMNRS
jgi:hypothetical protein